MAYESFNLFTFVCLSLLCLAQGRVVGKQLDAENSKNHKNGKGFNYHPIMSSGYRPLDESAYARHWAVYQTDFEFYGTRVELNVYGAPNIKSNQVTASAASLSNGLDGPPENFNTVQAGWQVNPARYHDYDVHFFTYWTADGYNSTGCFDLLCKGFVLDNSSQLVPGDTLIPSTYGGPQYYFMLRIQKDSKTGDWWLYKDDEDNTTMPIGYWPNSLFTTLQQNASNIEWGGYVRSWKSDKSPPMGSGHFPSEGEGQAASLRNIKYITSGGGIFSPPQEMLGSYVDRKDCYDVGDYETSNKNGGFDGYGKFLFGGPGGCTN
ncbi:uncharacterized protein LOC109727923 [Ananas comosus]|uniref:Uncharacterized protein LOC109727923 n=1 Tax=Ananas comosus TaxID=4615 RepID=A0A6P5HH21_ANACO|nr:uncharacterized protein LOC109727923 [Ananas comosus]